MRRNSHGIFIFDHPENGFPNSTQYTVYSPPPPFRFQLEKETSFTTKKGRSVDNSIVRAYTEAIRRAKRFIYVENQYFMGSAYGWLDDQVMRFPT